MTILTQIIMMTALWCGQPDNGISTDTLRKCRKEKLLCFANLKTHSRPEVDLLKTIEKDLVSQFVEECLK